MASANSALAPSPSIMLRGVAYQQPMPAGIAPAVPLAGRLRASPAALTRRISLAPSHAAHRQRLQPRLMAPGVPGALPDTRDLLTRSKVQLPAEGSSQRATPSAQWLAGTHSAWLETARIWLAKTAILAGLALAVVGEEGSLRGMRTLHGLSTQLLGASIQRWLPPCIVKHTSVRCPVPSLWSAADADVSRQSLSSFHRRQSRCVESYTDFHQLRVGRIKQSCYSLLNSGGVMLRSFLRLLSSMGCTRAYSSYA